MPHAEDQSGHVPVLAMQVLSLLAPQPGQVCLDCTIGRGGHARLILPLLAPGGRYIGLDADPANVAFAQQTLAGDSAGLDIFHRNFAAARDVLAELGLDRTDLLLADLGFVSTQVDDPSRGFSFRLDGPLDMRMNPDLPHTAADLIAALPERELADLIYQFGEERLSRKIARKIVEKRTQSPIKTTAELAQIVRAAYGRSAGRQRIDPATRTFQALRIAVNSELDALDRLLAALPELVAAGGTAAIISFHSLEDRRVKHTLAEYERLELGRRLTKKPIVADEDECRDNPRSRSAKLRAFRFG